MNTDKDCPDCKREMMLIRLIDKGDYPPQHRPLEYALSDTKPSVWFGRFPIAGQMQGLMCDRCGRVLLYAKPVEQ